MYDNKISMIELMPDSDEDYEFNFMLNDDRWLLFEDVDDDGL